MNSTQKLIDLGFAGIAPQVSLETHTDNNPLEGVGRRIQSKGFTDRGDCAEKQVPGLMAGIHAVMPRKSAYPKRVVGRVIAPEPYDPKLGGVEDRNTLFQGDLNSLQRTIRSLVLDENNVQKAIAMVRMAEECDPPHEWAPALRGALRFYVGQLEGE